MSRDIFVQDIPRDARSVDDIPNDFAPKPIGTRIDIIAGITEAVPTVDFSDPTWGRIESDQYSIEVNIGESDPVHSFALHVAGGTAAAEVVADILDNLGLRAFDMEAPTGIFDRDTARASMAQWRNYRDQALEQ